VERSPLPAAAAAELPLLGLFPRLAAEVPPWPVAALSAQSPLPAAEAEFRPCPAGQSLPSPAASRVRLRRKAAAPAGSRPLPEEQQRPLKAAASFPLSLPEAEEEAAGLLLL